MFSISFRFYSSFFCDFFHLFLFSTFIHFYFQFLFVFIFNFYSFLFPFSFFLSLIFIYFFFLWFSPIICMCILPLYEFFRFFVPVNLFFQFWNPRKTSLFMKKIIFYILKVSKFYTSFHFKFEASKSFKNSLFNIEKQNYFLFFETEVKNLFFSQNFSQRTTFCGNFFFVETRTSRKKFWSR